MPQLVAELGLTVQDFGMATSAFGAPSPSFSP